MRRRNVEPFFHGRHTDGTYIARGEMGKKENSFMVADWRLQLMWWEIGMEV